MNIDGMKGLLRMGLRHDHACGRLAPRGSCDCGFDSYWKSAEAEVEALEAALGDQHLDRALLLCSGKRPGWIDCGEIAMADLPREFQAGLLWIRDLEDRVLLLAARLRWMQAERDELSRSDLSVEVSEETGSRDVRHVRVCLDKDHPLMAVFTRVGPAADSTGGVR